MALDDEDRTVASQMKMYEPAVSIAVVNTLVLVPLLRLRLIIVVLLEAVTTLDPVMEELLLHAKDLEAVTFAETDAVHTILKVLWGETSRIFTEYGLFCTSIVSAM